ncbi:hypothetical protein COO60DRAFT_1067183 [Scenedesmus sp. NREL 46B-D3]|nr:hypothetical protein COO60DRAFT_1067183 [Scenedesmus sp. NREL 46B-D3]
MTPIGRTCNNEDELQAAHQPTMVCATLQRLRRLCSCNHAAPARGVQRKSENSMMGRQTSRTHAAPHTRQLNQVQLGAIPDKQATTATRLSTELMSSTRSAHKVNRNTTRASTLHHAADDNSPAADTTLHTCSQPLSAHHNQSCCCCHMADSAAHLQLQQAQQQHCDNHTMHAAATPHLHLDSGTSVICVARRSKPAGCSMPRLTLSAWASLLNTPLLGPR